MDPGFRLVAGELGSDSGGPIHPNKPDLPAGRRFLYPFYYKQNTGRYPLGIVRKGVEVGGGSAARYIGLMKTGRAETAARNGLLDIYDPVG
jgi:hypothetical protein